MIAAVGNRVGGCASAMNEENDSVKLGPFAKVTQKQKYNWALD